jgi:hypothetical protein
MAVESLSAAQLSAAIRQLVSSPGFGPANPHLSLAEISAIPNGTWPQKPVFTPYAITHHGYSQSKITDCPPTMYSDTDSSIPEYQVPYTPHHLSIISSRHLIQHRYLSHPLSRHKYLQVSLPILTVAVL